MSGRGTDGDRRSSVTKRKREQPESGEVSVSKRSARSDGKQSGNTASNAQRRAQIKRLYESYMVLTSEGSKSKADAAFKILVDSCGGKSWTLPACCPVTSASWLDSPQAKVSSQ
jgi:hypothetical protein